MLRLIIFFLSVASGLLCSDGPSVPVEQLRIQSTDAGIENRVHDLGLTIRTDLTLQVPANNPRVLRNSDPERGCVRFMAFVACVGGIAWLIYNGAYQRSPLKQMYHEKIE